MMSRCARNVLLMAALTLGATVAPRENAALPADEAQAAESVAAQEVRIRKLHLVRPDLIPYPLYYEVLC